MDRKLIIAVPFVILLALALIFLSMWAMPQYGVYKQSLDGKAILAHAQYSREVAVAEARAKMESASLLAQAEIERAKGVAEANKIIGEGLKGHEEYLRYLWIMSLEHTASSSNGSTVVYVPTESNLPVLEAGRFRDKRSEPQNIIIEQGHKDCRQGA